MLPFAPILVVQFLKVCDFCAKTRYLFPKHCEMIHDIRIAYPRRISVGANLVRKVDFIRRLNVGTISVPLVLPALTSYWHL